jgi:hypothetical protein
MGIFQVSTILVSRNELGGSTVEPVPNTDVTIKWISGGGSPLPETHGRTAQNGVASMSTPENYMHVGLPTGATGLITASNGTLRGSASVSVDIWGNPSPARIPIKMSGDVEGNVKNAVGKVGAALTKSAWITIGLFLSAGVLLIGVIGMRRN